MITNKFEICTRFYRMRDLVALILAVKRVTYISALTLNTVQPIGPLTFFFIPESWFFPGHSVN